jgi:hypothetical protein
MRTEFNNNNSRFLKGERAVGDGPELFQDERRHDEHTNDQVALILSNHSFEHRKSAHTKAPGLEDSKETDHKHGELDLLGFVKLAANDSRKSEYHTTEEKLIVEYSRPQRVRVVPESQDMSPPPAAIQDTRGNGNPESREQGPANSSRSTEQRNTDNSADSNADSRADRRLPAQAQDDDEVTATVVGYKKHSVDHVANHKHPEVLGGIFNIDTDSFTDKESALVRRGNEERFAEKSTKQESGSVNVGPIPLVYIGDKGVTNYYESKRVKLDPDKFVQTNKGFLPIDE